MHFRTSLREEFGKVASGFSGNIFRDVFSVAWRVVDGVSRIVPHRDLERTAPQAEGDPTRVPFNFRAHMQRAVAQHPQRLNEVLHAFRALDVDNDGRVAVRSAGGTPVQERNPEKVNRWLWRATAM